MRAFIYKLWYCSSPSHYRSVIKVSTRDRGRRRQLEVVVGDRRNVSVHHNGPAKSRHFVADSNKRWFFCPRRLDADETQHEMKETRDPNSETAMAISSWLEVTWPTRWPSCRSTNLARPSMSCRSFNTTTFGVLATRPVVTSSSVTFEPRVKLDESTSIRSGTKVTVGAVVEELVVVVLVVVEDDIRMVGGMVETGIDSSRETEGTATESRIPGNK